MSKKIKMKKSWKDYYIAFIRLLSRGLNMMIIAVILLVVVGAFVMLYLSSTTPVLD